MASSKLSLRSFQVLINRDGDFGLLGWDSSTSSSSCSLGDDSSEVSFWVLLHLSFSSSEAASSLNKMSKSLFFQKPSYTGVALGIMSPNFVRGSSELARGFQGACFISLSYFCQTADCLLESWKKSLSASWLAGTITVSWFSSGVTNPGRLLVSQSSSSGGG